MDRYETGPNVVNHDIVAYQAKEPFDLVLSISTFEHIGFDEANEGSSGEKIRQAFTACLDLLADDGVLAFTVPLRYNPDLDELIRRDQLPLSKEFYFIRTGRRNWEQSDRDTAFRYK